MSELYDYLDYLGIYIFERNKKVQSCCLKYVANKSACSLIKKSIQDNISEARN